MSDRVRRLVFTAPVGVTKVRIPRGEIQVTVWCRTNAGASSVSVTGDTWTGTVLLSPVGSSAVVVWPRAVGLPPVVAFSVTSQPIDVVVDVYGCDDDG